MRKTGRILVYSITTSLLLLLLFADNITGQTPGTFNYQAVLRGGDQKIRESDNAVIQVVLLQKSESGTEVYSEIHHVTTNSFGLVNLEIGSVDPENFALIDWANGPYYLKIAVDGVEMGTSQLLSVPFALYSANGPPGEKGEPGPQGIQGLKGDKGEKGDPTPLTGVETVFEGWDKDNTDDFSGSYNDLSDKPSNFNDADADPTNELQDLSSLAEKTNVLELDNTAAFIPDGDYEPATKKYVDDKTSGHYIGEEYGGGWIFWIDESGEHGLINGGVFFINPKWSSTYVNTKARRDGIGAGKINTERAYQAINQTDNIFWQCQFIQRGYGDWYIPSKYELNLLYTQREALGFTGESYWSSTEVDASQAWYQRFNTGEQLIGMKDWVGLRLTVIRSF